MPKLHLRCRDAARLMTEAQDRDLPWQESLPLRAHLLMCRNCTRFGQQLKFLRAAMRRMAGPDEPKG